MANIQISTEGVKKSLKKYKPLGALIEYIWNGFDAQANCLEVLYEESELGGLTEISIRDNGHGIAKEDLHNKFMPFYESEKYIEPQENKRISTIHGKNGVGRLTFFKFSTKAIWTTVYKKNEKKFKYSISIESKNLENYEDTEPYETDEPIGTTVRFENIIGFSSIEEIESFLASEFCWYLELNKEKGYIIKLNSKILDYTHLIYDTNAVKIRYKEKNIEYDVRYILWNNKLNMEFSCYYFIDSKEKEKFKETTSLNKKGDKFYHSVYIKSEIFDEFFDTKEELQEPLIGYNKASEEFKFIKNEVDIELKKLRKPFIKKYSEVLINELEKVKAFPNYDTKNYFEKMKKDELESIVRELYQIQPKIFVGLNIEQKKTLVRFLDLIMQSGEAENLIDILNEIVELDSEERKNLACLLKTTKMTNIIKTIQLIKDRYKAIEELKELVFNKSLNATEVRHLQKFIENHYWIFGEQYHLVTAAEPKFKEALRRFTYILTGEDVNRPIEHPDKNKEMDIFAVRQDVRNNEYSNIVVELKRPSIKLGEKELSQVKRYMNVILKQSEFNAPNMKWEFYLVGNEFDTTDYIKNEIENNKSHGEKSLVFRMGNYKIYVKTWSEIIAEFEMKHKYLNEKLELERQMLLKKNITADSIIEDIEENLAIQPGQVVVC